jgi:hypothetical protein
LPLKITLFALHSMNHLNNNAIDSILYVQLSLLLIAITFCLLTITEFNAVHIFANAGVVPPTTVGFFEWLGFLKLHLDQLRDVLNTMWSAGFIACMAAPVLATCILWGAPRLQRRIVIVLLLGAALDLALLLPFFGYNSANGGYDGGEGFVLRLLHSACGIATVLLALIFKAVAVFRS